VSAHSQIFGILRRAASVCIPSAALFVAGCSRTVIPAATGSSTSQPRLVGYLPDYHESYATYARTLDFTRMTHLILAFGLAPACNGACTAQSDMTISLRQTDADIATLVNAAHSAGVQVLISLGGGDAASDATISQFYLAGLSTPFSASIDSFVRTHNLDGVDVDIEEPSTMGAPYGTFVAALAARMHAEGKLITAATAPYLDSAIPDSALASFDFLNIESYSTDAEAMSNLNFYGQQKGIASNKLVLGVPFFATDATQSVAVPYAQLLQAYPNAWQTDTVSGGPLDGGITLYYVGETTMAQETKLGAQYGGVMVWELTLDAPPPHSLLNVIQTNL